VLVIDEGGDLILANPAAARTLGLSAKASMGQPLVGRVPSQFLEIFERVVTSGRSVSGEILTEQGAALYVSVSPVAGVGQVAVVQDITPLKELEEMRLRTEQEQRRLIRQMFELFADLRRFSEFTAAYPAHTVIEVLNEFYTAMVNVVHRYQGTVFDLAGDELMVGFGAPFAQENTVEQALHAAGAMQQTFATLRRRWKEQQGIEIGLGIGLDRGIVVMGSIGAPSHMNFGMVGNAVNTAHRMVELAHHGQIVVSEAVLKSLKGGTEGWTFERLPEVRIGHKSTPPKVYLAGSGPDRLP
jgi:PAS domain S-box-containing protein